MGAWGVSAWDNDGAAEWFDDMMETTKLAEYVEKTLQLDTREFHEDVRAAAYVLIQLGHTWVWPVDDLDRHLRLAIEKLEQIKADPLYASDDNEFVNAIESEIAELRSRLRPKRPATDSKG